MRKKALMFSLVVAGCISAGTELRIAAPSLIVTPSSPVKGGAVELLLIRGYGSSSCSPTYPTTSYKISQLPIKIYPPHYEIELFYTEIVDNSPRPCTDDYAPYGPRYTLSADEALLGHYIVKDGDSTAGTFDISEAVTVSGVVVDDPYPTRRMPRPIENARLYLAKQEYLYAGPEIPVHVSAVPWPVFRMVDSTKSDKDGAFTLTGVGPGEYRVTAQAEGYNEARLRMTLSGDTGDVQVKLLHSKASAAIQGNVSFADCPGSRDVLAPCALAPLAGCIVEVRIHPFTIHESGYTLPGFLTYRDTTDATGTYAIDIPLQFNGQTAFVYARKDGFRTGQHEVVLRNTMKETVDFTLDYKYRNRDSVTVDGVTYVVATRKSAYAPGDTLHTRYTVRNKSMHTVTYNFTSGCQYNLKISDDGTELYDYMYKRGCTLALTEISIAPGKETQFIFPGYIVPAQTGDLTCTAQMLGYPGSAVSVVVPVKDPVDVIERPGIAANVSAVEWSRGSVRLRADRDQQVTLELFSPNGRMIEHRTLRVAAGVHSIPFAGAPDRPGMALLRVRGETLQKTIKIGPVGVGR